MEYENETVCRERGFILKNIIVMRKSLFQNFNIFPQISLFCVSAELLCNISFLMCQCILENLLRIKQT